MFYRNRNLGGSATATLFPRILVVPEKLGLESMLNTFLLYFSLFQADRTLDLKKIHSELRKYL